MTTNTGQPTLELTLAAGLDLLQGLKRLRVLNVDRVVRHGIGKSELDWMKTCWPSLRELYGLRSGTLVSMKLPVMADWSPFYFKTKTHNLNLIAFSFFPMPPSPSANDPISQIRKEIASLQAEVASLRMTEDDDPQITRQQPETIYTPSNEEVVRYPFLRQEDPLAFFKTEISDDDASWERLCSMPKNSGVVYKSTKVPPVTVSSVSEKGTDAQLHAIQQRLFHLCRRVDTFLHYMHQLSKDEETNTELLLSKSSDFAVLVRKQLAGIAGWITTMRIENLQTTQGDFYKDDPLNLVDPKEFLEEIKASKALEKAFKSRFQSNDSDRTCENKKSQNRQSSYSGRQPERNSYQRY
ncbi:hypothetical protein BGZ94_002816 [Podila epigama]|nr:hypothetical protein BGZ94_002816 [Podila epigama]